MKPSQLPTLVILALVAVVHALRMLMGWSVIQYSHVSECGRCGIGSRRGSLQDDTPN